VTSSPPLHFKESPAFAADRSAYWRHLRELAGGGNHQWQSNAARLLPDRADDVRAALLDPETFASPPKTFKLDLFGAPLPQVPLSCVTRSEHARFGRVLHPLFSPKSLAPFAPVLRAHAATLAGTVAANGGVMQPHRRHLRLPGAGHGVRTTDRCRQRGTADRAAVVGDTDGQLTLN